MPNNKIQSSKIANILVVLLSTTLSSVGQIFFKYGVLHAAQLYLFVGAGIVIYIISTLFYLYVLSREHLSWTYGVGSMGYIFAVVLAVFFLPEGAALLMPTLYSALRWIGIVVITIGVVLISLS